jgi:GntR family transcriptional repressor for pyruvate dehydrogenase complex
VRKPKLADRIVEEVRQRIAAGVLKPGDRLPTEPALIDAFGVSRTVVREAIAALSADGWVEARQGSGVFVVPRAGERLTLLVADAEDRLTTVLNVLELRTAIEVEAAALAAVRRSPAQEAAIGEALAAFDAALRRGQSTSPADLAFHHAIAAASNNPLFAQSLESLGYRTIPRDFLAQMTGDIIHGPDYLARIQGEHAAILAAISASDPAGAGAAMRVHLTASRDRYQALLRTYRRAAGAVGGAASLAAADAPAPDA